MANNQSLLENHINYRKTLKKEIKELEEDIFKYRARGDSYAASNAMRIKKSKERELNDLEKKIFNLEKQKDNDSSVYGLTPKETNPLNANNDINLVDGKITDTIEISQTIKGTKGSGDNKTIINQTNTQRVTQHTEVKNHEIWSQKVTEDKHSVTKTLANNTGFIDTDSGKNQTNSNHKQNNKHKNLRNSKFKVDKYKSKGTLPNSKHKSSKNSSSYSRNSKHKYYNIKPTPKKKFIADTDKKDMKKVLNAFKKGLSIKEVSKKCNIPINLINSWLMKGKQNTSAQYYDFYKEYCKIFSKIDESIVKTDEDVVEVDFKVKSNSRPDSSKVKTDDDVVEVDFKVKSNSRPDSSKVKTDDVVVEVDFKVKSNTKPDESKSKNDAISFREDSKKLKENNNLDEKSVMNLIIFNLREGKTLNQISRTVNVPLDIIEEWISKGKKGNIKYVDFYNEYNSIKSNQLNVTESSDDELQKNEIETQHLTLKIQKRMDRMGYLDSNFKKLNSRINRINVDETSVLGLNNDVQREIKKFEFEKKLKEIEIVKNKKLIAGYGYPNCENVNDFKNKVDQIKKEIKKIDEDIAKVGKTYNHFKVKSLRLKKAELNNKLYGVDDFILLLEKQKNLDLTVATVEVNIGKLKQSVSNKFEELKDMEKFLNEYREASSIKEAAEKVNIKPKIIRDWIHDGRDRLNRDKIYFYNEFIRIQQEKKRTQKNQPTSKHKIKYISKALYYLRREKTRKETCNLINLSLNDFNKWYNQGQLNMGNENIDFYNQVNEIELMNKFLKEFRKTNSIQKAMEVTDVSHEQYVYWCDSGKEHVNDNTVCFVKKINKIKQECIEKLIDQLLNQLKLGKTHVESCKTVGISTDKFEDWYLQGKKGNLKFVDFYKQVNTLESQNEKKLMDEFLKEFKKTKSIEKTFYNTNISPGMFHSWRNGKNKNINNNSKYFNTEFDNIKESVNSKSVSNPTHDKNQKKMMKKALYYLRSGKSKDEVSEIIDVPISTINKWYNLGKKNSTDNTIDFYNQVNKIKPHIILNDQQTMEKVLKEMRTGKSLTNAGNRVNVSGYKVKEWYGQGSRNYSELTVNFHNQVNEIESMNKFLIDYKKTKSVDLTCSNLEISRKQYYKWYSDGKDKINVNAKNFVEKLNEIKNHSKPLNKSSITPKKKMDLFLSELRKGKSKIQASASSNIPVKTIDKWYNQGKKNHDENTHYFYTQFNSIQNDYKKNQKIKMDQFLSELDKGKSKIQASKSVNIPVTTIDKWYNQGKRYHDDKTRYFYIQYKKIKKSQQDKNEKIRMNNVLSEMKKDKTMIQAARNTNINIRTINEWYEKGKQKTTSNTIYFYDEVNRIEKEKREYKQMCRLIAELKKGKTINQSMSICGTSKTQLDEWVENGKNKLNEKSIEIYDEIMKIQQQELNEMGKVLDALNNGKTRLEACQNAGIEISKLNSWINQGKQGLNKNAELFLKEYDKINMDDDYIEVKIRKTANKFCSNCGNPVNHNDKFCTNCGHELFSTFKREKR